MVLVLVCSFFKKGSHNLQEWDESRNGVNAYEMLHNKDVVNFYFDGRLDTWNAKPPLMIWLITASYKVFGFNEFALRFPSTIATIIFFIVCFNLIVLLDSALTAFLTCMILVSSKSIFGNHIGITGDFDALLLLFLTASVYFFIQYTEFGKIKAIYFSAVCIGLAFYTKGPAAFVLMPGFFLYILYRKKTQTVLKHKHFWFSSLCVLLIIFSWIFLVSHYGKTSDNSVYGSKNSIETLFIYDTFRRLTANDFEPHGTNNHSLFFFFQVLDSRLNLWNYLFYIVVLVCIITFYKKNKVISLYLEENSRKLTVLSFFLIVPLALVLSLSANQHNWYLAPTFMFIAYLTAKGSLILSQMWKPLHLISICLLIFTLSRHVYYLSSLETDVHDALTENIGLKNKKISVTTPLRQDVLLYLKWLNVEISRSNNFQKGDLVLSSCELEGVRRIQQFEGYILGEKE